MIPVLRTCGRSFLQCRSSFSKPLTETNEINVGLGGFCARSIGARSKAGGKIGFRKSKPEVVETSNESIGGLLLKPALFTVATCTCAFSLAAIYKYEDLVSKARRHHLKTEERDIAQRLQRFFEGEDKTFGWRQYLNQAWTRFSAGERMAMGCIFVNLCVFAGWRIQKPAVMRIMERYFTSSPFGQSPCSSMLLSTFSHNSFTHLAVNMICLWSFAPTVVNLLGKEQAAALYVSAGMTSSLASYVVNVMRATATVSVGASGAILGLAGAVCMQYPDAKLAVIFLPMFPFAAKYALVGLIGLDTAGLVLRWKLFDHAGHLGGTLFGVGFVTFAQNYISKFQKELVQVWHSLRE